jgi:hypothetical protein
MRARRPKADAAGELASLCKLAKEAWPDFDFVDGKRHGMNVIGFSATIAGKLLEFTMAWRVGQRQRTLSDVARVLRQTLVDLGKYAGRLDARWGSS